MTDRSLFLDRRSLLGGLGATFLVPAVAARAQTRTALALEAVAGKIMLKPGQPPTQVWRLVGGPDGGPLRVRKGETIDVTLTNRLPVAVALNWSGLDGNPQAEPWTARPALAPNAAATVPITCRDAGTMLVGLTAGGGADSRPTLDLPVIVSEPEPAMADRDEVLLLQEWRLKPDGTAVAPGSDPIDAAAHFTVNGNASQDITAKPNQRLRLRFINGSQHTTIAVKINDHDVCVVAIDGQPSEPFLARDQLVVLTPGSRVDAVVDAVRPPGSTSTIALFDGREGRPIGKLVTSGATPERPAPLPAPTALPSNDLPAQLDLKSALRINVSLGTPDWLAMTPVPPALPPAFKARRGRTVVLALSNRGPKPVAFHLHGHHFRLLDRLDDGWKPFWLDRLAIDAGQTQRVAFRADFPGLYPMQTVATEWAAPRLIRSYLVE